MNAERNLIAALPAVSEPTAYSWMQDALCAEIDPEMFFPPLGGPTKAPKHACSLCDVQAECLEYALANDVEYGIFGGLSPRERRARRTAAGRAAA